MNPDSENTVSSDDFDLASIINSPFFMLFGGMAAGLVATVLTRFLPSQPVKSALSAASSFGVGPHKMVLVVRTDIGMTKGKAAAQCAHAALSCYKKATKQKTVALAQWEALGCAKVCLKVDSEEGLIGLAAAAREASITCGVVRDAGRTQVAVGTITVLGIGPAPVDQIDKITGHLKLY